MITRIMKQQRNLIITNWLVRTGLPEERGRPEWPKTTWRTVKNKRQAAEWQLWVAVTALATS